MQRKVVKRNTEFNFKISMPYKIFSWMKDDLRYFYISHIYWKLPPSRTGLPRRTSKEVYEERHGKEDRVFAYPFDATTASWTICRDWGFQQTPTGYHVIFLNSCYTFVGKQDWLSKNYANAIHSEGFIETKCVITIGLGFLEILVLTTVIHNVTLIV